MKHRIAISLSFLLALTLGSVAAQDTNADHAQVKQRGKKHVKATLKEEPATPATAPAAEPAEPAESAEPAKAPATASESPAEATAAATSTTKPATEPDAATAARPTTAAKPAADQPAAAAPAADLATAAATTTDNPAFQERIEVVEVLLDAVVKKNDQVVTGLGPQDFVVEEEGKPVEVTSARFYGAPEQLQASGEGGVERADRYFILFFHDRSRDASFVRPLLLDAGQQARKWVEEERLPNDQVAVMTHDVRLKVYSDFTRDQDQILEAISRAVANKKEPDRGAGRSQEPLRSNADSPSLLLNLPAGPDLAKDSRQFEKAMALLGRAAEGIVGRKNLLLFSVGFGEVDPGGFWTPDLRYYPALEQNLNDGNVAVYSIDLLGSRRGPASDPGITSSLSSVAADTAGLYFDSFTNFLTPMKEIAKDTEGYYLLSYRSEYPRGTTGYREVSVKTRDQSYDVRARKGYMYGAKNQPVVIPDADDEDDDPPLREPSTG